jgi:ferredoxin
MAIKITEECINCGACEPECPNNAIYEGGVEWSISDGTTVKGSFTLIDGTVVDAEQRMAPLLWILIILPRISALNARVFMKSHSVQLYVPLIAVFPMRCIRKRLPNCWRKKRSSISDVPGNVQK